MKQLKEEDLKNIFNYKLMDVEEYAGTQIKDWQINTTKNKKKTSMIFENTKSEEID